MQGQNVITLVKSLSRNCVFSAGLHGFYELVEKRSFTDCDLIFG